MDGAFVESSRPPDLTHSEPPRSFLPTFRFRPTHLPRRRLPSPAWGTAEKLMGAAPTRGRAGVHAIAESDGGLQAGRLAAAGGRARPSTTRSSCLPHSTATAGLAWPLRRRLRRSDETQARPALPRRSASASLLPRLFCVGVGDGRARGNLHRRLPSRRRRVPSRRPRGHAVTEPCGRAGSVRGRRQDELCVVCGVGIRVGTGAVRLARVLLASELVREHLHDAVEA